MTEGVKTLIYLGIRSGSGRHGVRLASAPDRSGVGRKDRRSHVRELRRSQQSGQHGVRAYDSEMGELRELQGRSRSPVRRVDDPSNAGYPADAEQRMRDAALMLVDLKSTGNRVRSTWRPRLLRRARTRPRATATGR
jgi:hypothetical protein